MHEEPEIPNFAQKRKGIKLAAGMTLAIEPMITAGRYDVAWMDDGPAPGKLIHSHIT